MSNLDPSRTAFLMPKRDRDHVGDERRPKTQCDRDGHLFKDQVHDTDRAEVAFAEIEAHVVPHHVQEPLQRRFIKAELAFQFFDELFRQAACAHVVVAGPFDNFAATARDAFKHIAAAFHLGNDLFDRPAWHELGQREIDDHDPKQGRDHKQQPAQDVCGHGGVLLCAYWNAPASFNAAAASASYHQKSSSPSANGGMLSG